MGYTHYWRRPKALPKKKFAAWAADCRTILGAVAPVVIRGECGRGLPECTVDRVVFNGDADDLSHYPEDGFPFPDVTDLSCEDFRVTREHTVDYPGQRADGGLFFEFCKTRARPYDTAVCACLVRFKAHFPGCEVSSDGDSVDWGAAVRLCTLTFGEHHDVPDGIEKVPCSACNRAVATRREPGGVICEGCLAGVPVTPGPSSSRRR